MKKRAFSRILFSLLLLLFLILFAFLCICAFYHVSYTPEACTESADELSNPYIGFYSMYGYVLGNDTLSNLPDPDSNPEETPGLVMLELNLRRFADQDISDPALAQLDTILSSWQKHGNSIILRFLYDWDGERFGTAKPRPDSAPHGSDRRDCEPLHGQCFSDPGYFCRQLRRDEWLRPSVR